MIPATAKLFISSFKQMQYSIHANASAKGFWKASDNVPEKLALIHSEVSEALEYYRHGDDTKDDKLPHRKGIEVELADTVIRAMDLAAHLKLDLAGAIIEKHEFNLKRPHMHGKRA